jgi:hypothetical protein
MLKFGIHALNQIKDTKRLKTFFAKDKNISITLYKHIQGYPTADMLAERILLLFSDERGAYKRTYQKRFEKFDKSIISILKKTFITSDHLMFYDVGISDGRTALDFFEKMALAFPNVQYVASDYNPTVYVVKKDKVKVTLSHTGKILEILFPPFVFNKTKMDRFIFYPLNHIIRFFVEIFVVRPLMKEYKKGLVQPEELLLFAPRVLHCAEKDKRFKLRRHDLLSPLEGQACIIRAMNVLNISYFSESEFMIVIKNLYLGLKEGGLFITGSNQDAGSIVHGGVYKKYDGGFKKIFQSGNGSPIDHLILRFKF